MHHAKESHFLDHSDVRRASQCVAADLPARTPEQVPPAYNAPFRWSGIYIGLNAGGVFGTFGDNFGESVDAAGFFGGGQIGAQVQMGQIVVGIEADFQGASQNHNETFYIFGVPVTLKEKMPWFGTVRGRFGWAFDRLMVYGTGGVAWVDGKAELSTSGFGISTEANNIGWTAGAGIEWAFFDHWSTKVEYLYVSSSDIKFNSPLGSTTGNIKNHLVRAGVNYRF